MTPSARSDIAPFVVMDVMEAAARLERSGRRVLHLEVGQPSTPAPRTVLDAAARGLKDDVLGYTVSVGITTSRLLLTAAAAAAIASARWLGSAQSNTWVTLAPSCWVGSDFPRPPLSCAPSRTAGARPDRGGG